MVTISFKLDDRDLRKKIQALEKLDRTGIKKALDDTGDDLVKYFGDDVFRKQGVGGERWKALAPSTLMARAHGWGYYAQTPIARGKILIWTGRLKSGFQKVVKTSSLIIKNTVDYFKYHQLGKRRILIIDTKVIQTTVKNFEKYIKKAING